MSKERKNKQQREAKVLGDHTQKGKTFVAFDYQNFKPISYIESTLPELIWIHMLIADHGAENALTNTRAVIDVLPLKPDDMWLPTASSIAFIAKRDVTGVQSQLKKLPSYQDLRGTFERFSSLYPTWPMTIMFDDLKLESPPSKSLVSAFKAELASLYDKRGMEAGRMLAVWQLSCKKMQAPPSGPASEEMVRRLVSLENSDSLADMTVAGLCAMSGAMMSMLSQGGLLSDWPSRFWERGFELEPIDWSLVRGDKSDEG